MESGNFRQMKSKLLSKREKRLLKITGCVLVISLFIYTGVNIFYKLRDINKEVKEKEFILYKYLSALGREETVLQEQHYKDILLERSSADIDDELTKEVGSLAGASNVKIERIKTLSMERGKGYGKFFLEVEVGGDFTSLFRFINQLEASPLFIKIYSCRFYPQGGTSLPLQCKITLLKIFFD